MPNPACAIVADRLRFVIFSNAARTVLAGFFVALLALPCVETRAQAPASGPAPLVSSEIFAAEGLISGLTIAPDGNNLVFRQRSGGKTYLTVRSLGAGTSFSKAVPEDSELKWFRWAGSDKILFSVSTLKQYRGARGGLGSEFRQSELYVIDIDTKAARYVGPEAIGPDGDNVLHVDKAGRFLILSARESIYKYPEVYRVNLETGEAEKIIGETDRVWDWVTDTQGVVRLGYSYRQSSTLVYYRGSQNEDFRRIEKVKDKDILNDKASPLLDAMVILPGSHEALVLSNAQTGRFALYRYDLLRDELGEQVFAVSDHDLAGFTVNSTGALRAATWTQERDRIHWFDPELAGHQTALESALPGQEVWITSHADDRSRMVV